MSRGRLRSPRDRTEKDARWDGLGEKPGLPTKENALPGRAEKMPVAAKNVVLGTTDGPPSPRDAELALFGMGCFWGVERKFWQTLGASILTSVGYARRRHHPEPDVPRKCAPARRGTTEVAQVVFDPKKISYEDLLPCVFWENHDPTKGMRQGNDAGTQYRSGIYTYGAAQKSAAEASRIAYQKVLTAAGHGAITTEILDAPEFYYAEDYHQQYLEKNPDGYCGVGGTGVSCPVGLTT